MTNFFKKKIENLKERGMTNKLISKLLFISPSSFYRYKKYPKKIPEKIQERSKTVQIAQIKMYSISSRIRIYDEYGDFHEEIKRMPYMYSKSKSFKKLKKEIEHIKWKWAKDEHGYKIEDKAGNYVHKLDKFGEWIPSKDVKVVNRYTKSRVFNFSSAQDKRGKVVYRDIPLVIKKTYIKDYATKKDIRAAIKEHGEIM